MTGKTFDSLMAEDFLGGLHFFLSLVQGARTGPILTDGLDDSGRELWRHWATPRVSPWKDTDGWFRHADAQQLPELYEGFARRWKEAQERPILQAALHWYVEANRNSGGLEGALILAQAALELMSSVIDGKGKRASDRIRALLSWLSVSPQLPDELAALHEARTLWGYSDGPHAITMIRNGLTHASGYQRLADGPKHVVLESHTLALWYLELALLKWLGYSGEYGNRLLMRRGEWERERVPWARAIKRP